MAQLCPLQGLLVLQWYWYCHHFRKVRNSAALQLPTSFDHENRDNIHMFHVLCAICMIYIYYIILFYIYTSLPPTQKRHSKKNGQSRPYPSTAKAPLLHTGPGCLRLAWLFDASQAQHRNKKKWTKQHLDVGLGEGIHSHLVAFLASFQVSSIHRKYVGQPQK